MPEHRGTNGNSEDVEETDELTTHVLDWAKKKVGTEAAGSPENKQAAAKSGRWEMGTVIVVAVQGDGPDEVKARLFEDSADAERFVQTLVDANVDQERIAVLRAKHIKMNVTYRPVVQLGVGGDSQGSDDQDQQP